MYDDIDEIPLPGRPLAQRGPTPPENIRYDKLSFNMPWKQSARFRQLCHERNLTASVELRKLVIQWLREHDLEQTI